MHDRVQTPDPTVDNNQQPESKSMAPAIPSAKITLSCPLFAADFDPQNDGRLLVGGGGGEGRSGVGNRIVRLHIYIYIYIIANED